MVMRTEPGARAADGRVRLHWGWMVAFGIITMAAGICALVWPGITLVVAAIVFGIQLIFAGIYRLVAALAADDVGGGQRVLLVLVGVLSLIAGLYAVRHVLLTIVALALLLGIFWVLNGVMELFTAVSQPELAGRGWRAFLGVFSIVAGLVLLAVPGISLLTLVFVLSAWLLLSGVAEVSMGLWLRSAARPARGRLTAASRRRVAT